MIPECAPLMYNSSQQFTDQGVLSGFLRMLVDSTSEH